MEKVLCYFRKDQRQWLDENSVDKGKRQRGLAEGKTQSEHIRGALDSYIKNYKKPNMLDVKMELIDKIVEKEEVYLKLKNATTKEKEEKYTIEYRALDKRVIELINQLYQYK